MIQCRERPAGPSSQTARALPGIMMQRWFRDVLMWIERDSRALYWEILRIGKDPYSRKIGRMHLAVIL